jgi:predicted phosphodiesterase
MPARRLQHLVILIALLFSVVPSGAPQITLPNQKDSLKFAIIGDSGTGSKAQYQIAQQLTDSRAPFAYEFILMMGDNLYGGSDAKDFQKKFEDPYKPLLNSGMKFYATLGNHDNPNERFYERWNMNGQRYYTFKPKPGIRFFSLDSNYMDPKQLEWFEKELTTSGSDWKIAFFHHPIYSSGGAHGSDVQLRQQLEPLFLKYGVDVVFAGHEHFYERIKPQRGIYYFISGGAAKLREGDVNARSELTAKSYDSGYHFMLIELGKDTLYFQTINQDGKTVDSGSLTRFSDVDKKKLSAVPTAR